MARFTLMHLSPAAREAFRAYRNAARTAHRLGERQDLAHRAYRSAAFDMQRLIDGGEQPHPTFRAMVAQREEAFRKALAEFEQACEVATAAAHVAVPALAAEGYPFGWWHTGTMRLPAGVVSPGHDRLARRR